MTRAPIVGITGPDRGGYTAWSFTSWGVRAVGGRPVRITPTRPPPPRIDALIVGGGADVTPDRYGGELRPEATDEQDKTQRTLGYVLSPVVGVLRLALGRAPSAISLDRARDELELSMIERAFSQGLPVLGICRGAQLLNVHAGGTLYQDLATFYTEKTNPWTVFPAKRIRVAPGSHLARALGVASCSVNSLHRQAIAELGADLRAVARDDQGVVQGVEAAGRPFWIGVQWHPEYLPQMPPQRRLLRALVDAARSVPQRRDEPEQGEVDWMAAAESGSSAVPSSQAS